jgi:AraC family ethanolamine operon transcriptional activator
VRIQGILPRDLFAFTMPLRYAGHTRYWGAPLHERGLPVAMPGGIQADFSAGQRHLIALVDLGSFRESVPEELKGRVERCACGHLAPASAEAVARLGARLDALIDEAQANPQALDRPRAVRSMEQDVLGAFWRSLTLPESAPRRVGGGRSASAECTGPSSTCGRRTPRC